MNVLRSMKILLYLREFSLSLKMDHLPPQHLYKILSYLRPKSTFIFELMSKKINEKLKRNPYWFRRILSFENEIGF